MPLTSPHKAYQISGCAVARRNSDVAKKVKLLLEQLQVCIFAEIVFGIRCTSNCLHRVSIGFNCLLRYDAFFNCSRQIGN